MQKISAGRVLVVDDEVIQTEVLARVLSDCDVDCANDGRTAIEIACREIPDLILLDVHMPGMDGFEVCQALKSMPKTREIPVIFLTAQIDPTCVARAFQAGAVDYIPKPYEYSEIKERVRTHLALKKNRESLARQNLILEKTVREQEININLARDLLQLINGTAPRYIDLDRDLALFVQAISRPCYQQGGDHYLIRTVDHGGRRRTVISLKDQSGHKVNCVLRSIACDLYHNSIIRQHPDAGPGGQAALLNNAVVTSGSFQEDDFFTAINLELDHSDLTMKFISAGHPPLILIRGGRVSLMPGPVGAPGANLPFCVMADQRFETGEVKLEPGDRLILFTDGLTAMPTRNNRRALTNSELAEMVTGIVSDDPDITVSALTRKILDAVHRLDDGDFKRNDTDDDISILGLELERGDEMIEEVFAPSDDDEISGLVENLASRMASFLEEKKFSINQVNLRMAVNEAFVNAWHHGCGRRPGKKIRVRWRLGNDFNFEVIDQGPGFDPERVADPTLDANIKKNSGRGLFIIRKLSSWLRWRDNGRHLIASFAAAESSHLSDNIGRPRPVMGLWGEVV